MKLENKVAVVTGAGRGIGKAIATRLAEEGARVVVNDIEPAFAEHLAEKFKEMGRESLASKADVSNQQEVEQMFKQARRRFGGVDILVNCAVIRASGPLDSLEEEIADLAISV